MLKNLNKYGKTWTICLPWKLAASSSLAVSKNLMSKRQVFEVMEGGK
jgi:hypothetical protein